MRAPWLLLACCFVLWHHVATGGAQLNDHKFFARARVRTRMALKPLRDRIARQRARVVQQRQICYDMVGCFENSRRHSALRRIPQDPDTINTKFFLYTRENSMTPHLISYGDDMKSLSSSNFSTQRPLKVMIHGYKGSITDAGAQSGIAEFLNLMDVNLLFVDWTKGAAGPSYPTSVANTELVGRQLALILLDMLILGVQSKDIHIIGFSLGAHIAACASYVLQTKGVKIGRITGLDPASPIYKSSRLLDSSRKLDKSDAEFVDVIHTDGSRVWTNGFGLLKPLGHVDFFPNGGREQPGCNDGRASLVVSHFEGTTNTSVVCSHVRAWRLFVESLTQRQDGCQFMAFPCPEGSDKNFVEGSCFPPAQSCQGSSACGQMGIHADASPGRGPLFLVTRDTSPFCGAQCAHEISCLSSKAPNLWFIYKIARHLHTQTLMLLQFLLGHQLRASIFISERTPRTRGILQMTLKHSGSVTNFKMHYEFPDIIQGGRVMWGLGAAKFGSITEGATNISALLSYQSLIYQRSDNEGDEEEYLYFPDAPVYLDKITIQELSGNSWHYCKKETLLREDDSRFNGMVLQLTSAPCTF